MTPIARDPREVARQREDRARRRRTNLALAGAGISLLVHVALLMYLGLLRWTDGGGGNSQTVTFDFALIEDASLDDAAAPLVSDDVDSEAISMAEDEPAVDLEAAGAAVGLTSGEAGALPTLGGGGGDGIGTLGGGASASFFGVSSKGSRIVFIVDRSASMDGMASGAQTKLNLAVSELLHSVNALPDYARFHVVFFPYVEISGQRGWVVASPARRAALARWLLSPRLTADGGTEPIPAFEDAFRLDPRPDVIFFLTDGIIPQDAPEMVRTLNRRGRPVVINTIAVGKKEFRANPGQDLLRKIAADAGGSYRFVSTSP